MTTLNSARTPSGWLALAALAVVVGFLGLAVYKIANPTADEAYRRTFMTGEFPLNPNAPAFRPDGGLAYVPGTRHDLVPFRQRRYFARFDWRRFDPKVPYLTGFMGRLFLSVPDRARAEGKPHRLTLWFACRFPEGEFADLAVSVNGTGLGAARCAAGDTVFEATIPAGVFPKSTYEEIRVTRTPDGFRPWLLNRLSLRYDAVALTAFEIKVAE
jgi:hypothetical protein